jgi:methyl-accepting chemotaxis protein
MWAGLSGAALFLIAAFVVVINGVLRPLARLTSSVSGIGAGNLTVEVPDQARRDEIGHMAGVVEQLRLASLHLREIEENQRMADAREIARRDSLLDSIKTLALQVNGAVALVKSSADAMSSTSAVLTISAVETAGRSSSAEQSLHGNTEAIQSMAAATSELSSTIEEVSAQGRRIVDSIETMAAGTQGAGLRLDELHAISGKAQSAVDLIASVADQTNLLALNATIEAARAGEAGRGFAVVASEVKVLASQAAQATADIRGLIESMNVTAGALQEAVSGVLGGVGDLKAVATFVKDAVDEQSRSTAAISRSIEETAQASALILSDVRTMNRSAQETGDAAEGAASVARDLMDASQRLETEIAAFSARMAAA